MPQWGFSQDSERPNDSNRNNPAGQSKNFFFGSARKRGLTPFLSGGIVCFWAGEFSLKKIQNVQSTKSIKNNFKQKD